MDWHGGGISSRRMANLIKRLPRSSETSRAVNGPAAEWGPTEHLLAIIADRLARIEYAYTCVNSDGGTSPTPPEPIPRPGDEPEPEPSPADIAGFFA